MHPILESYLNTLLWKVADIEDDIDWAWFNINKKQKEARERAALNGTAKSKMLAAAAKRRAQKAAKTDEDDDDDIFREALH